MGTLGPNDPTAAVDDASLGTISFGSPTNALLSDNAYSTAVLLLGQVGHYLKATGFQFAIPLDATILGILVEIERSSTVLSATQDSSVRLVKAGTIVGDNKALGDTWPTTDTYQSYGGSTDLWGTTWTPADLNASTFGVVIAPTAVLTGTAQIDHVRVTVTYQGSNRISLGRARLQSAGVMTVERI